jgi:hypothetical protein
MDAKYISDVLAALVKAKKFSQETGLLAGEFRCERCGNGLVRWQLMNLKKNTTRGACTTEGCLKWIE